MLKVYGNQHCFATDPQCIFCTLAKRLTFLDGPFVHFLFNVMQEPSNSVLSGVNKQDGCHSTVSISNQVCINRFLCFLCSYFVPDLNFHPQNKQKFVFPGLFTQTHHLVLMRTRYKQQRKRHPFQWLSWLYFRVSNSNELSNLNLWPTQDNPGDSDMGLISIYRT